MRLLLKRFILLLIKNLDQKEGQTVIIKQALYGLKSSAAAWRAHLAQSLMAVVFGIVLLSNLMEFLIMITHFFTLMIF